LLPNGAKPAALSEPREATIPPMLGKRRQISDDRRAYRDLLRVLFARRFFYSLND